MRIPALIALALLLCACGAAPPSTTTPTESNSSEPAQSLPADPPRPQAAILGASAPRARQDPVFADHGGDLIGRSAKLIKNTGCGCCEAWAGHLRASGAVIDETIEVSSPEQRWADLGVPPDMGSCHSGVIDGYVFEGHVPASAIAAFLSDPPKNAIGLAVPGMPAGSPGMEFGSRRDAYQVFVLFSDGKSAEFKSFSERK